MYMHTTPRNFRKRFSHECGSFFMFSCNSFYKSFENNGLILIFLASLSMCAKDVERKKNFRLRRVFPYMGGVSHSCVMSQCKCKLLIWTQNNFEYLFECQLFPAIFKDLKILMAALPPPPMSEKDKTKDFISITP